MNVYSSLRSVRTARACVFHLFHLSAAVMASVDDHVEERVGAEISDVTEGADGTDTSASAVELPCARVDTDALRAWAEATSANTDVLEAIKASCSDLPAGVPLKFASVNEELNFWGPDVLYLRCWCLFSLRVFRCGCVLQLCCTCLTLGVDTKHSFIPFVIAYVWMRLGALWCTGAFI